MSDVPPPPPTSPTPPTPPTSAPSPSSPPSPAGGASIGKPRSALLVILLSIVTLGVWTWIWSKQNGDELQRHNRTGLGGWAYFFITLILHPVTMFLMAGEVEQMYRREGKQPPITTIWGLWFLLPLVGNLIWYLRIQSAINRYWAEHGSQLQPGI
jgi:hypothetical protein